MRFSRPATLLSLLILPILLPSCGVKGGNSTAGGKHPKGTGPYDSNGNYIEAWADTPSKWGKPSSTPVINDTGTPTIARNEQPPDDAIPLASGGTTLVDNRPSRSSREVEVATKSKAARTTSRESDREVASKPKSKSTTRATADTRAKSRSKGGKEVASNSKTKSKTSERSAGSSKSKSQAPRRYVVKKGDSLSTIAARNKTTVTALQRANGIKGTLIQPGKSLVIPRY